MKQHNYPVLMDGSTYPKSVTLYWGSEDICISVEVPDDYKFDGDFTKFIKSSYFCEEHKEHALSKVKEIEEQYNIYDKWVQQVDIKDVAKNIQYGKQNESLTTINIKDFIVHTMNICTRENNDLKNFLDETITVNSIYNHCSFFAFEGVPFIILLSGENLYKEYDMHGNYVVVDEIIFKLFVAQVYELNSKHMIGKLVDGSSDILKSSSPYLQGSNIERWETAYKLTDDGDFVETIDDMPSEILYKKVI